MTANEQADKILIESLYKKISELQNEVIKQRQQLDAMVRIIKKQMEV
jgi:hypothetical protein